MHSVQNRFPWQSSQPFTDNTMEERKRIHHPISCHKIASWKGMAMSNACTHITAAISRHPLSCSYLLIFQQEDAPRHPSSKETSSAVLTPQTISNLLSLSRSSGEKTTSQRILNRTERACCRVTAVSTLCTHIIGGTARQSPNRSHVHIIQCENAASQINHS